MRKIMNNTATNTPQNSIPAPAPASYYIALPIGFYCETGRNVMTTSLRFATRFDSGFSAAKKGKEIRDSMQLDNFVVLQVSLTGGK